MTHLPFLFELLIGHANLQMCYRVVSVFTTKEWNRRSTEQMLLPRGRFEFQPWKIAPFLNGKNPSRVHRGLSCSVISGLHDFRSPSYEVSIQREPKQHFSCDPNNGQIHRTKTCIKIGRTVHPSKPPQLKPPSKNTLRINKMSSPSFGSL